MFVYYYIVYILLLLLSSITDTVQACLYSTHFSAMQKYARKSMLDYFKLRRVLFVLYVHDGGGFSMLRVLMGW